jgi:mono/diheme cytochrome c family protein
MKRRLSVAARHTASGALLLAIVCYAATAQPQSGAERGKELFVKGATPPCGLCHVLADAGTVGAIGPSLDELKPDAERVAKAVKTGIGQMPAFSTLSDQDVQAIAQYVARASGGAK